MRGRRPCEGALESVVMDEVNQWVLMNRLILVERKEEVGLTSSNIQEESKKDGVAGGDDPFMSPGAR